MRTSPSTPDRASRRTPLTPIAGSEPERGWQARGVSGQTVLVDDCELRSSSGRRVAHVCGEPCTQESHSNLTRPSVRTPPCLVKAKAG